MTKGLQTSSWYDLDFVEKVRAAIPEAQDTLLQGGIMGDPTPSREHLTARIAHLTGDQDIEDADMTENEAALLCDRLESAVALGIAIGLLLRPEAFEIGRR